MSRAAPGRSTVYWGALLVGSILSVAVSLGIATGSVVVGSIRGQWAYGYIRPFDPWSLIVILLASAIACGLLFISRPDRGRREWLVVGLWFVAALGLQALVHSLTPVSLGSIFTSDYANSFYGVTRHYSASTAMLNFDRLRLDWPAHVQTNMPGKLMLVYALTQISTRPSMVAWMTVAISNVGGLLTYVFVRDLFSDRRAALYACVLYFFVPGKLFFFPLLNAVTPVMVLVCACLCLRGLLTKRLAYAALLGLALYGLAFFEPMALVTTLLVVPLAGLVSRRADVTWRSLLPQGASVALAFTIAYAAMRGWFGFDLVSTLRHIGADAAAFNAASNRPYTLWLGQNLLDFLFGVGLCQAVLVVAALKPSDGGHDVAAHWLAQPMTMLCVALLGMLAILDVMGVMRGEVIRLWIFLACLFQIPVAVVCARLQTQAGIALVLVTTIIQGGLGTAMIGFINP